MSPLISYNKMKRAGNKDFKLAAGLSVANWGENIKLLKLLIYMC